MVEITGVVYAAPVPMEAPPVRDEYQLIVPAEAVAASETAPGPQTDPGVLPVIVGIVFTVAEIAVLEAVVQEPEVAST